MLAVATPYLEPQWGGSNLAPTVERMLALEYDVHSEEQHQPEPSSASQQVSSSSQGCSTASGSQDVMSSLGEGTAVDTAARDCAVSGSGADQQGGGESGRHTGP
eukprot:9640334-Alexandrium_andersonii.AAC.1